MRGARIGATTLALLSVSTSSGCHCGDAGPEQDTTAPVVVSVSPADGATEVALHAAVTIGFSERVDCGTVIASSFTVSSSQGASAGAVSCSGDTATFAPTSALSSDARYTVWVGTAVTDLSGNAMASAFASTFTTRAVPIVETYTIGGTLSGLGVGQSVTLANNGGDDRTLSENGPFTFATPLATGSTYHVTVRTQPVHQTCVASNNTGTVRAEPVNAVRVDCAANVHSVGGTVQGLVAGSELVLENNRADPLLITRDGAFTFPTKLPEGAPYHVTVLTQPTMPSQYCTVAGSTGTVGAQDVTGVGVECWTWGRRRWIELETPGDVGTPSLTVQGDDQAWVVWHQSDGTRSDIWAARYWAPFGWLRPGRIDEADADARNPQIAGDEAGNAVAVWEQDFGRTRIVSNRYDVTRGWGTATRIEPSNSGIAGGPQIGGKRAGGGWVVWRELDTTLMQFRVWAMRYEATGLWSAGTMSAIDSNITTVPFLQIAADEGGNAIAAWERTGIVFAKRYRASGAIWSSTLFVGASAVQAATPDVAVDGDGNGMIVFTQLDGATGSIFARGFRAAAEQWDPVAVPLESAAEPAYRPQFAFNSHGDGAAIWVQSDGVRTNIFAAYRGRASGWSSPRLVELDDAGSAAEPQIAVTEAGHAVAVWRQHDGDRWTMRANMYLTDFGWGPPARVEPCTSDAGAGDAGGVQVGVDQAGKALAVWRQFDGRHWRLCTSELIVW